jgi:hypothetical protein
VSDRKRPRTLRREEERRARALVRDKQRLAALEAGGAPDRPIAVTSASVVDVRARSIPCPLCGGELRLDEHKAQSALLRELRMSCVRCGVARSLWFRIGSPLPS